MEKNINSTQLKISQLSESQMYSNKLCNFAFKKKKNKKIPNILLKMQPILYYTIFLLHCSSSLDVHVCVN